MTEARISPEPVSAAWYAQARARLRRLSELDQLAHYYPEVDRVIEQFHQDIVRQIREQTQPGNS